MRGFDQYRSLISKRKGLAGMAENMRQGYRAGRTPRGYRLVSVATGAVRDGATATKSKLESNEDAPRVAQYLQLRAEGIGRGTLIRRLKLPRPETSLNGMQSVWNVHNEVGSGGVQGRRQTEAARGIVERRVGVAAGAKRSATSVCARWSRTSSRTSRRRQAAR